jgi:hypothetical protein
MRLRTQRAASNVARRTAAAAHLLVVAHVSAFHAHSGLMAQHSTTTSSPTCSRSTSDNQDMTLGKKHLPVHLPQQRLVLTLTMLQTCFM